MKTFFEFTQEPQNQMPPNQQANLPPQNMGGHDDETFEDLSNILQRIINQKLLPAIEKNRISKPKAMQLLSGLVSQVSNHTGLTSTNIRQATNTAIKTNAEPIGSPPLQPQAI